MSRKFEVDEETELLMSGYLREMQDDTTYIIPELVHHECLRCYNLSEKFMRWGSDTTLSEIDHAIHTTKKDYLALDSGGSAHGAIQIKPESKYMHRWKFECIRNVYWY